MTDSTPAARLKRARIEAGFSTATAAAEAFGWPAPAYRAHEAGRNKFGDEWAQRFARAFHVAEAWLLYGKGQARSRRIPILSFVGAGAEVMPFDGALDETEPPPGVSDEAFALIVRGDSMAPVFEDGDILVCAWEPDLASLVRRRAVVDLADGRRLIKQLLPGGSPGRLTLASHNGPPILDAQVIRAARIVWHKPA